MNWFALVVRPLHDKAVEIQLQQRSLESYAPVYGYRRRWSDRVKTVFLPLFPGYVFCRCSFQDRLKVLNTPGVTSFVGFGGKPSPLSHREIEAVKAMVGSGLPVMPWPYLHVGQHVRVTEGSLSGLEGILARRKSGYRVVVNVELLGRAVAVEVERDVVQAVDGARKPPASPMYLQVRAGA